MFLFLKNLTLRVTACGQFRMGMFAFFVFLTGTSSGAAAVVQLREERCSASGNVVTLGDIAEVYDADPNQMINLKQTMIMPAPVPGRASMVDHLQIKSRLQAVGFNSAEIEFTGRSQVWIEGAMKTPQVSAPVRSVNVSQTQQQRAKLLVEQSVATFLATRFPHAGRFQVEAKLAEEQAIALSQSNATALEITGGSVPLTTEQIYLVQFKTLEGTPSVLQVPCAAQAMPRVLAIMRGVNKGQILSVNDLGWRNASDQELKRLPLIQPEQVIGREATRDLRAGDAVTTETVRTVPLVNTGETVSLYSRRGGIVVRTEVRSMGTAGQGEYVTVQGPDNRTKLTARVIGFHEVEVVNESADQIRNSDLRFTATDATGGNLPSQISGTGGYGR